MSAFQRHFVAEVKRCDELERKIRFLNEQVCSFFLLFVLFRMKGVDMLHVPSLFDDA